MATAQWSDNGSHLDIISDFAGQELFVIHGESMMMHCLAQAHLYWPTVFPRELSLPGSTQIVHTKHHSRISGTMLPMVHSATSRLLERGMISKCLKPPRLWPYVCSLLLVNLLWLAPIEWSKAMDDIMIDSAAGALIMSAWSATRGAGHVSWPLVGTSDGEMPLRVAMGVI